MWGGLPCIYMRILWKEVFNPIHFKTLFVELDEVNVIDIPAVLHLYGLVYSLLCGIVYVEMNSTQNA